MLSLTYNQYSPSRSHKRWGCFIAAGKDNSTLVFWATAYLSRLWVELCTGYSTEWYRLYCSWRRYQISLRTSKSSTACTCLGSDLCGSIISDLEIELLAWRTKLKVFRNPLGFGPFLMFLLCTKQFLGLWSCVEVIEINFKQPAWNFVTVSQLTVLGLSRLLAVLACSFKLLHIMFPDSIKQLIRDFRSVHGPDDSTEQGFAAAASTSSMRLRAAQS